MNTTYSKTIMDNFGLHSVKYVENNIGKNSEVYMSIYQERGSPRVTLNNLEIRSLYNFLKKIINESD